MAIHDRFGVVVLIVALAGAVLALAALVRPSLLPAVAVYLRLEIVTVAVQVVIGLALLLTGERPQQLIHWFYGAAVLLSLPLGIFIGRSRGARGEPIWLAGGAVATFLFAIRAVTSG